MAEKRRGLGRGLGSLIPSQETGRPSDVFFPRGERSEDVTQQEAAQAAEAKSSDPAESMRRAQASRRSTTTRSAAQKQTSGARTPAKKAGTTSAGAAAGKTGSTTRAKSSPKSSTGSTTKSASAKKATSGTRSSAQTSGSKAAGGKRTSPASTAEAAEPADPTAQIDTDTTQTTSDRNGDASHSTQESSNTATIHDAAATTKSGADPVDDAVDETRDGIYVSRETVRTHPSDRQVDPGDSGDAVDILNGAAGAATDAPVSPVAVDNSPTDVPDVKAAESAVTEVADADPIDDDAEADAALEDADDLVPVPGTTFGEIDLDLIRPNPRQPRDVFDEDALDELITSIREIGVLQPVVVRRRPDLPGHYELIMGERRYRASKEAGRTTIPAIVRATADDDLLRDALLENLHRVDLNPLEEAAAYAQLLEDFNCTQEELSDRIGRSRPQISNTIRLLKLPAMVQRRVAAGVLSSGHARALLGLNDGADMEQLAQRVVAEGLSVRATEEAVILLNRGDRLTVSRGTRQADPELAELARNLGDRLDTRVNVVMGKRKGKLSVEFANGEDLARILTLLGLDSSDV